MTNDIEFFEDIDTSYKNKVKVASQECCEVYGIGSGQTKCVTNSGVEKSLELKNVLFVPCFDSGLLSIRALDCDGYNVKGQNSKMTVFKSKEEIATADVKNELYVLRVPDKALKVSTNHSDNCIHQWHHRLGHRNSQAIQKIIDKDLAIRIKINPCDLKIYCECRIRGKLARKSFPKRSTVKTTNILELIHSDLCGPMPESTGWRR